jgi:large subunit ribosomal protein L32
MPVPPKRHPSSKKNRRRANIHLDSVGLAVCPKCAKPIQPHHACSFCGFYKSKSVVKTRDEKKEAQKVKKDKKEKAAQKVK